MIFKNLISQILSPKFFLQIFVTHLAYVALGIVLFTPLVGFVGHFLLSLSGQTMLSDMDIVYFLLTSWGLASLILFASLLIAILVFEQASLMAISSGNSQGLHIGIMSALNFTARRVKKILFFAIRLVLRILIIVLPFLAVGGAIAWLLLTDYDINYYLSEKPPVFMLAASAIGLVLLIMLVILIRKLLSWSLALPLILFSDVPPAQSFMESEKLAQGNKGSLLAWFGVWALTAFFLGAVMFGGIQLLGSILVPLFFDSIDLLVIVLGVLVALWSLGNLFVTTFASGSFACLLMAFSKSYGLDTNSIDLTGRKVGKPKKQTAFWLSLILIGSAVVAMLVGSWLLNGIQIDDDVAVIAHRGSSGKAPENTLAAIRQAVTDGADWVEIDVQETSDGEVVVIHDSDFMKLAGVDLKVWDSTIKELEEIDVGSWFGPEFSAERVPTLAEALDEVCGKSRLLIELKYYGHDQQLEQRVVDIVEQADMVSEVGIMSLNYNGMKKIHAIRPDWFIGLLSSKAIGNLSDPGIDFYALNMGTTTSGLVRRIRSYGKQVFVWTVNGQTSMSRMMSMGVDGIITDEPELAREVLVKRSDLSSVERLLIHTAVLLGQPIPQRIYRDQSP